MPSNIQGTQNPKNGYFARFSDGKSASARDATVKLGLSGVEIVVNDTHERKIWRYDTLKAAEPLRKHAIDALLSSSDAPNATLFVPNPTFARELSARAPALTAGSERWRHARPWLIGALAVIALLAAGSAAGFSPARALASVLPETWRNKLGQQAIQSMTEGQKRCTDPAGVAAVEKLTKRLADGEGRKEPFKVVISDWSLMNAFAVPGSQIVMTRGLIEKAGSADEVAGVLAHEMGHGIKLHPETGIIRAVGMAAALQFMLGGGGGSLANLGLALAQLGYTRAAEHEADVEGLELLKAAKISPKGLGDFFKRVSEIEGDDDKGSKVGKDGKDGKSKSLKPFDLLRSHPPTAERAALIRNQPDYPATPALDAAEWQALKDVCKTTVSAEK